MHTMVNNIEFPPKNTKTLAHSLFAWVVWFAQSGR